jgi:hypothetical protein
VVDRVIGAYKGFARFERAFRSLKTVVRILRQFEAFPPISWTAGAASLSVTSAATYRSVVIAASPRNYDEIC